MVNMLSKEEKKELRMTAIHILDSHCNGCKTRTIVRREKDERASDNFCLKSCEVGSELTRIGKLILQ